MNTNPQDIPDDASPPPGAPRSVLLSEKQRRELWLYLAVTIGVVEILITGGALCYSFIAASAAKGAHPAFPWLSWGALMVVAPALILLLAHFAGVGLFRTPRERDLEWQKQLPERMQRLYRLLKGAPAVVVLFGLVALGAALATVDGVLTVIGRAATALAPYIPHILAAIVIIACAVIGAAVWLRYRTRRMEYDYRREVLEKTGVVIVDRDSTPLPPGGGSPYGSYLPLPDGGRPALQQTKDLDAEIADDNGE